MKHNLAEGFHLGRLWSLWDLMHKLRANTFFKAYEQATALHQMLKQLPNMEILLQPQDIAEQIERLTVLSEELMQLGIPGAAACIDRALEILRVALPVEEQGQQLFKLTAPQAMRVQTALSQGTSRVPDDLAGQVLLALDPRRVNLYAQPSLFGPDVFNNFESSNDDISEAGTCLALDRGTACVMHLMRVLEVGLSALSEALGVKKQNDWGSYLREIDKELSAKIKASGARSADEQFYAEAATSLDNMRRAWRNPTMHPEKTYTVERAEEILAAVGSFMRHLATKLHE